MKKLKCVLLSERNQSEKTSCCTIPIIQPPEKGKTMETVKESVVARSWEAGRVEYKQNFRSTKPFCMIVSCSRPMSFYISQNSLNELHQELFQISSFQSLSCVQLFATPWTAAYQASLSITNSWSPPKLMSIGWMMPSNHLILCRLLLLLPSVFPSIRVFSSESALRIRWPKYWSFSFNISSSNEHPGLISFRMDWLDLLAVQGTLKSLLQYHS